MGASKKNGTGRAKKKKKKVKRVDKKFLSEKLRELMNQDSGGGREAGRGALQALQLVLLPSVSIK